LATDQPHNRHWQQGKKTWALKGINECWKYLFGELIAKLWLSTPKQFQEHKCTADADAGTK
jgi:hypothetical protein